MRHATGQERVDVPPEPAESNHLASSRPFDGGLRIGGIRLPHLVWAFDGGPGASGIRPSCSVRAVYGVHEAAGNRSPRSIRALGGASKVGERRPF